MTAIRRLAAILAADVAGYSRLIGANEGGTLSALKAIRSGFTVTPSPESGDKLTRFGPFSSQCRAGNVKILRGPWNEDCFAFSKGFPISPMMTRSTPGVVSGSRRAAEGPGKTGRTDPGYWVFRGSSAGLR
jgi:hypothetical protein